MPPGTFEYIPIDQVAAWMKSQQQWLEAFCMNNHMDPEAVKRRIDEFVAHCIDNGETDKDKRDCMRHFNNWMRKRRDQPGASTRTRSRSTAQHPATHFDNNQHFEDF